jgi:fructosamine-3-kinase
MSWKTELASAIGARVISAEPVSGGDINDAYRVRLDDKRTIFVKTHAHPPSGMFAAEAHGLDWLRGGSLRIPKVFAAGEHFLALEWLEIGNRASSPTAGSRAIDAELGRGLARLHEQGAASFGLERENFLATLPQDNTPASDGVAFWIEQRLRPLAKRARDAGHMPDVQAQLDTLRGKRDRFGPEEPPARLHGDLWWGNVVATPGPTLVDPAVYGGHREVDLAMLALFGGVSPALVDAYHEVFPLAAGWRERVALWQLYPLAAHACLFGGGYGAQFARSLAALL